MDTIRIENISRALADGTRLRIFEAIAAKDGLTCTDLARLLAVAPATISHHLKILTSAALVECRKEGKSVNCRAILETVAEYTQSLTRLSAGHRRINAVTTIASARYLPPMFL
jgi:ArsR family transcriptional regulator